MPRTKTAIPAELKAMRERDFDGIAEVAEQDAVVLSAKLFPMRANRELDGYDYSRLPFLIRVRRLAARL